MQPEINLGWGNPYFLLDILSRLYNPPLKPFDIKELYYPPKDGIKELRELTKKVIKETTGLDYKHIIITNGATSAINTILRHEKPKTVYTSKYGYPLYERMIKDNGMKRVRQLTTLDTSEKYMRLIDSPSNPEGNQFIQGNDTTDIWDAVYHSKTYTDKLHEFPKLHKYHVGSYSKLLGVAGCRIGFIATNNMFLNAMLFDKNWKDLAGVSTLSQKLIIDILKTIDLQQFMGYGNAYLCSAREEFSRIEYLFDGQAVNDTGMFYCAKTTPAMMDFFTDCGIGYIDLDQYTIRLSMGNTIDKTKAAIDRLIKKDRSK